MATPAIEVTDHAVIRWLERAKGMDIYAIRREIADLVAPAVAARAVGVKISGIKFAIAGHVVCTVIREKSVTPGPAPIIEPRRSRTSEKQKWKRMIGS